MVASAISLQLSFSIASRNRTSSIPLYSRRNSTSSIVSALPSPYGDSLTLGLSSKTCGLPRKCEEKDFHDTSTSYEAIEARKGGNPPVMPAVMTPGGPLDLSSVLFRNRIIFIGQPINSQVAQRVISQLVTLATIDENADILVYLNCPGGSTYSVLAIYDCMSWIKPKVGTVCFHLHLWVYIALVTAMVSGASPITGFEMSWVNWVMCLIGSQVLLMALKSQELLTHKPAKGTRPLLTKAMWGNIAVQVIYQVFVLLIFQFKGFGMHDDVRKTMIFNMFFLCQIFNQFNAMDLVNKQVLEEVVRSYWFLVTLAAVITMQVVVIEYLGIVTNFVRLNPIQWASCCIVAALSLGCDLALKSLADILKKWHLVFRSVDSNAGFSNRMPRPFVSHFGVPFFMFLFHAMPGLFAIVNQYENLPVACK